MKTALQIPNFDFPGVATDGVFEVVAGSAAAAEDAGFDAVLVMDHVYQLPMLGPPDNRMLEAYTLLGAIAARTSRVQLGTLVTGNTYRNPAMLAKTVTTLDVISQGRAICGIGAGWFEEEHVAFGWDFPPVGVRFDMLNEALHIITAMFRDERPTFDGDHYRVKDVINSPAPVQAGGPPIMIGGTGEKRTLRLVAEYATHSNMPCTIEELPRKLDVLESHCADVGRDRSEITVSWLGSIGVAATTGEAERVRDEFLRDRMGMDYASLDDDTRAFIDTAVVIGDPDTLGEAMQARRDAGFDGTAVNLPANGHDPEAVALAGQVLTKVFE